MQVLRQSSYQKGRFTGPIDVDIESLPCTYRQLWKTWLQVKCEILEKPDNDMIKLELDRMSQESKIFTGHQDTYELNISPYRMSKYYHL